MSRWPVLKPSGPHGALLAGRQDSGSLEGFITARCGRLQDCDPTDRASMQLQSRLLDSQEVCKGWLLSL